MGKPYQSRFQKVEHLAWAAIAKHPPAFADDVVDPSPSQKEGLRFERTVQREVLAKGGGNYLESPWLMFNECGTGRMRWCQPDGLLFAPRRGIIYVLEIKLRHCLEAWWQLHEVYRPVLSTIFPPALWEIRCAEIVRWFDPIVDYPGKCHLRDRIRNVQANETGVVIWSRRRAKRRL